MRGQLVAAIAITVIVTAEVTLADCKDAKKPKATNTGVATVYVHARNAALPVAALTPAELLIHDSGQTVVPSATALAPKAPVIFGLLLDSSGSFRNRNGAARPAVALVKELLQAEDQCAFVVNFNDQFFLDADLTSDPKKLDDALAQLDGRGASALYDALYSAADYANMRSLFPSGNARVVLPLLRMARTPRVDTAQAQRRKKRCEWVR